MPVHASCLVATLDIESKTFALWYRAELVSPEHLLGLCRHSSWPRLFSTSNLKQTNHCPQHLPRQLPPILVGFSAYTLHEQSNIARLSCPNKLNSFLTWESRGVALRTSRGISDFRLHTVLFSCASTIVALGPRPKALQRLFQIRHLPASPPGQQHQSEATSLDAETQQLPYPQEQLNSYKGTRLLGILPPEIARWEAHLQAHPLLSKPPSTTSGPRPSPPFPAGPAQSNSHCTKSPADGRHCFPGRRQVISSTLRGHPLPGHPPPSISPHLQGDCRSRFPWATHCRACGDQPNPAALRLRY